VSGPTNPFVVPGCEDKPNQPLCPWRRGCGHHEFYFSHVGGHQDAYRQFAGELRRPDNLSNAGRLVVVTGPESAGKTSLVNRCAAWVQNQLDPHTSRAYVYDLMGVVPESQTVCGRLTTRLKKLGTSGWLHETIKDAPPHMNDVLPLFGQIHESPPEGERTPFFIILLPALEPDETAKDEVPVYCAALYDSPGVICLTEYSAETPAWSDHAENPPITLGLRHLRPGESFELVRRWPNAPLAPAGGIPGVHAEVLAELETYLRRLTRSARISTGRLLATLRDVYDSRIHGVSKYETLDYVGYTEVLEFHLPWLLQNPQGSA
jgi:hypothetical protein